MPPCVYFFVCKDIMVVPFVNRAASADIPHLALAKGKVTVKEVLDDFANQCEPYRSVFECVQVVKGNCLRIHFPSEDVKEDILAGGLNFRGQPLVFRSPTVYRWVTVVDLPYGIPPDNIRSVLSKHGEITQVRMESYKGVYTGTRLIRMRIKTAIPSRINIAGHLCTVFYRGQIRSCFRCGQPGHESKACPKRPQPEPTDPRTDHNTQIPPQGGNDEAELNHPVSPRLYAQALNNALAGDNTTLPEAPTLTVGPDNNASTEAEETTPDDVINNNDDLPTTSVGQDNNPLMEIVTTTPEIPPIL